MTLSELHPLVTLEGFADSPTLSWPSQRLWLKSGLDQSPDGRTEVTSEVLRWLVLPRMPDHPRARPKPAVATKVVPTCRVTTLAFTCTLTILDPTRFRYRWSLGTARRVSVGVWTYAQEDDQTSLPFTQQWPFLYPKAASMVLEVEGGNAGPVEVTEVDSCEKPWGHTLAVDAV